ncbi:MAG: NADPH-dependent F420 reductase [Gemmatimonadales bacterium]
MKIGIIGAGNIGGTLTRRLTKLGHEVFVANSRSPDTLSDLARETGAHAVWARDAARAAKLVVVTVPEKDVQGVAEFFDGVPNDVVVIDTGNYYPERDGRIGALEAGTPQSKWVSEQLRRPVIKAFNTIRAQHLMDMGRPKAEPSRIALPVAGDDTEAKKTVMQLVDDLGFDPVDDGGLDDSWRQQPGTPVYAADLDANDARKALAEAKR